MKLVFSILIVAVTMMVISPLSAVGAGPMRIGVPSPSVSYFPAVVAWKKGFFSQEGIQAEFIVMRAFDHPGRHDEWRNSFQHRHRNRCGGGAPRVSI